MPSSPASPLRVAVIGSGPSGFYAAGHLLGRKDLEVEVDLFERLPTPWGLVRGGVAPDHPKIKSVSRIFEKTAKLPGFRFFGNVEVGKDVTAEELTAAYDAVLYTVGTAGDRKLGIPGEDLAGSWAAPDFVGWYNGHPDYRDLPIDLSGERAVVVGNGNVAVDVARMLTLTEEELRATDTADHAIEAFVASTIKEIVVLGRRGPEQAAFTTPELRELGELEDADVVVNAEDLEVAEHLRELDPTPTAKRNLELLEQYAAREPAGKPKRVELRFLESPLELVGEDRVEGVRVARNALERDGDRLKAVTTDDERVIEASLVLRAVGYTGVALPGVPFDERRGLIPHDGEGRVLEATDGDVLPGVYVAGWIKRGPSGVIGTNKKDAQQTVEALLADAGAGAIGDAAKPGRLDADGAAALVAERAPEHITYAGWEAIDEHEQGLAEGARPRVKLTRVDELLDAAGGVRTGS